MLKINAKHLAIIQLKYPIQTKPHKIKGYMGINVIVNITAAIGPFKSLIRLKINTTQAQHSG